MKYLFCLLLLTCTFLTNSWGQLDNYNKDLKIGFTYFPAYDGSNFTDYGVYAEYTKKFVGALNIGLGLSYSSGEIGYYEEVAKADVLIFEVGGLYSVLQSLRIRHDLRVGVGIKGLYQNLKNIDNRDKLRPGAGPTVNYDYMLAGNWMIGLRASAGFFQNSTPLYLFGAHVGYKFK